MNQQDEIVIVPVHGDPLTAVTMIYAIARSLAITKLEEAVMWMREAAAEEGE